MKTNALLDQIRRQTPQIDKDRMDFGFKVSDRISKILKEKGLNQRQFAQLMGKRESEVSKWMTGMHNFTIDTILKMQRTLNEPIFSVVGFEEQFKAKAVTHHTQRVECVCSAAPKTVVAYHNDHNQPDSFFNVSLNLDNFYNVSLNSSNIDELLTIPGHLMKPKTYHQKVQNSALEFSESVYLHTQFSLNSKLISRSRKCCLA